MLEPDSFATDNLFPAGKVRKTWDYMGFLVETPYNEKTLARSSFVLEALVEALSANAYIICRRQWFKNSRTISLVNYSRKFAHNPYKR